MKLRHVPPLALAVWYLLSPPVMRLPRWAYEANTRARLKYWKVRGAYASLSDCDVAGRALIALDPAHLPDDFVDLPPAVISEVTKNLFCIADDDPRLKQ